MCFEHLDLLDKHLKFYTMATENNKPSAEKLKALQAAMAKIDKNFGKGSIMKLGDEKIENVPIIPTGSIGLNLALGVGGYP